MELWIRSQNKKKLDNIKHLELDNDETGIFDTDGYILLGKYNSKERALEILDEIEDLIMGKTLEKHINKFDTYNSEKIKVYEMPEE